MRIKKTALILLAILIVLPCFVLPAYAANSASITVNTSKPDVGKTVTVNLNFTSSLSLYATTGTLTYNTSVLKYVSGGASASGSTISLYKDHSGEKSTSYSIVFQTIAEGSSALNFHIEGSDGEKKSTANASRSIVVAKAALSSNANLSYLRVSEGTLSPAFSPDRTNYSVTVRNEISSVSLSANVADGGSTYSGTGSFALADGVTTRTITVTAADGTKKSYNVAIKRLTLAETEALDKEARDKDATLVVLDSKDYHIVTEIQKSSIPKNFKLTKFKRKDTDLPAITDKSGKYKLVYLKSDNNSNTSWYKIGDNDTFEKINYIISDKKMYIVEDITASSLNISDGWFLDTFALSDNTVVPAYLSKDSRLEDFCVLNCYYEGETEFFKYDKKFGTIQRYPDFEKIAPTSTEPEKTKKSGNFISSLKSLSKAGKLFFSALILVVLLFIALIILVLIKSNLRSKRTNKIRYGDYVLNDDEYDESEE